MPDHALLAVAQHRLISLEDRHIDAVAQMGIAAGIPTLVAEVPRLWIDLNRSESDLDPTMVAGAFARSGAALSLRARGGLGLIPRRLAATGDIWRGKLASADVEARIATFHRPYHDAISHALGDIAARFGTALLIDLHSMPSLGSAPSPQIVIGDRFGRTAAAHLGAVAEAMFAGAGLRTAMNAPYAGGHTIERHARPATGIHALQIEIDRSLYLDDEGDGTGPGLPMMQRLLVSLVQRLGSVLIPPQDIAAE